MIGEKLGRSSLTERHARHIGELSRCPLDSFSHGERKPQRRDIGGSPSLDNGVDIGYNVKETRSELPFQSQGEDIMYEATNNCVTGLEEDELTEVDGGENFDGNEEIQSLQKKNSVIYNLPLEQFNTDVQKSLQRFKKEV